MNKKEIKEKLKEKPTEEEIDELALTIAKENPDYINILLTKSPRIGRAVQLFIMGTHTTAQIASLLQVTSSTVRKWFNDPDIKKYIEDFQREEANIVRARMHATSAAALDKMVKLLDSPIDGVALQAAKDLLDRAGHKPKQEVRKEVTIKTFEQQILDLVDVEDVEYEEVDDDEEIDIDNMEDEE